MGQLEHERDERKSSKGKPRGQSRRKSNNGAAATYQLTLHSWALIQSLIALVANEGGAVRVGFTRDGGALAIGLYTGDEYGTEYVRPSEDETEAFREIADAWTSGGSQLLEQYVAQFEAVTQPQKSSASARKNDVNAG